MTTAPTSRAFPATIESLPAIAEWIGEFLGAAGVSEDRAPGIAIAVAEAATNVARHTFGGRDGLLTIEVSAEDDTVRVTLIDDGTPFDPVAVAPRDRRGDEQHGMGLAIIRDIARELAYERRAGRNRFTMRFARS